MPSITAPSPDLKLANRELGTVEGIDQDGRMSLKLGAALGHDVSHSSAHAPEMKPEQKQEQVVTPQLEIAQKQEQSRASILAWVSSETVWA